MDQYDELDVYGTFTPGEARRIGVVLLDEDSSIIEITNGGMGNDYGSIERVDIQADGK
jgi:nucleobase:cation symporter-1, NCS1 family